MKFSTVPPLCVEESSESNGWLLWANYVSVLIICGTRRPPAGQMVLSASKLEFLESQLDAKTYQTNHIR